MKARGRSEEPGRRQKRASSRDSSTSSAGREVRCACQYFQSDSLLPERSARVGRPPSRTSNKAVKMGDHEYEPISPPPDPQQPSKMDVDVEVELGAVPREGSQGSTGSRERRFLRIPLDDDLVMVPGDGEDEDAAMAGRELGDTMNGHDRDPEDAEQDKSMSTQELQARLEERYFTNTPTTTESRTDCDINTSQLDSSGLEDLPLKRDARKKKQDLTAEQQQSQARGIQQRIRSQAGRLRTKIRNMPRPKFSMPERPKFSMPERPKFNLPERPKFSMPERPKFTMPERPKFNLPERPKFNLPERPKFNLPERPKFNLPERPKFNFPDRPKFNLPERPKFTMPERPKFNLPQRPKLSMPNINLHRKGTSSTRRPLRDRPSTTSTSSSKKNIFDFDFKTYPRIFDRKARSRADYATSSPKATRAQTPPPKMPSRRKGPIGQRWLHKFSDINYADENLPDLGDDEDDTAGVRARVRKADSEKMDTSNEERFVDEEREVMDMERPESAHTESTTAFRDKDYTYAITMEENRLQQQQQQQQQKQDVSKRDSIPESDREQRSSCSSSDRRRAGVLEEIDSDEFFLREKGLSQEDVDVGRYLTSEIRDAFRSPANALSQMDKYEFYDEEEDVENLGQQYRSTPEREPTRPARTRSLRPRKRTSKNKTPSPPEEDNSQLFNTFPPTRPKRNRRQQQQQQQLGQEEEEEEEEEVEEPELELNLVEDAGRKNYEEKEEEEVEADAASLEEPVETTGKRISPSIIVTKAEDRIQQQSVEDQEDELFPEQSEDNWPLEDDQTSEANLPEVPKRKRRSRRDLPQETLCNGHYTKEDWLENIEAQITADEIAVLRMEPDYIIPASPDEEFFEEPPVPPKRGRRKGSRGTSLVDEDRTSRGAESLPSEREAVLDDVACDIILGAMDGYASVDKSPKPERPRRPKPPRPPAPGRRKRSTGPVSVRANGVSHFFSLPRRAIRAPPVRPLRNYSTLGPSRPPRRERVIEPEYEGDERSERKSEAYMEIEDDTSLRQEETHGSSRDLQSGDVIEKMKGRPLPPPPRPPRKGREGKDSQEEHMEEEEQIFSYEAKPEEEEFKDEPLAALSDNVFYSRQEIISPYSQYQDELRTELEEVAPIAAESLLSEKELEPEEVSVATQTDPLPDDVCVEIDEQKEPVAFADACTETNGQGIEVSEPIAKEKLPEPVAPPPPPEPIIIEKPIPYYVMPDPDTEVELKAQRLQVAELDVERLNVGELQAQKILVSDIDGMSLQVSELSSKSGHLIVSGIELPTSFLQELVELRMPSRATEPVNSTQSVRQVEQVPLESCPSEPEPPTPVTQIESIIPQPDEISSTPPSLPEPIPQTPPPPPPAQPTPSPPPVQPTPSLPPVQPTPSPPPVQPTPSPPLVQPTSSPPVQAQPSQLPPSVETAPPQSSPLPPSVSTSSNVELPQESAEAFIPEYIPSLPAAGRTSSRHVSASQRALESEEEMISVVPAHTSRRRRHHSSKPQVVRYSSDEEEEEEHSAAFHPPTRRQPSRGSEPSVGELSRQLVLACQSVTMRAIRQTLQYASSQMSDNEDKRRDLQTALCVLLVLVAGLILLGFGSGKTFHHHHWDYLFPPGPPHQ